MSTNRQRREAREEGNSRAGDEEPGPSGAFQRRSIPPPDNQRHSSVSSDESPSRSSAAGNVKARNVSRDRPNNQPEARERKRARISDGNEHDDDADNNQLAEEEDDEEDDDGVHMETDNSSDEGIEDNVDDNGVVDLSRNVMDFDQPDSLPVQDVAAAGTSSSQQRQQQQSSSRRSSTSNADENVSTTMQSSSLRRPSLTGYHVDAAIASTSAAAMAPPLSRILERSPILDEMYNSPMHDGSGDSDVPGGIGGSRRRSRSVMREPPIPSASVAGSNMANRAAGGSVDLNENRGGGAGGSAEAFLDDKLHGKQQRLMWARKLFFLSTELVFPGFMTYSDNKIQMPDYMGVRVRSSCLMQGLLYADLLFFIAWTLSFLSTFDILITVLKELHGYLSICLTLLFILVNVLRLRFGLKGNEHDEVQYLALFWMTTVIVQIPLFTFIFLTDLFCPVLLAFTVTMDGVMMVFILIESVVGFIHFRSLLRDELNIIKMVRRSKETSQSRANIGAAAAVAGAGEAYHPHHHQSGSSSNVIDLSRNLPDQDGGSSSEENDEAHHALNRQDPDFLRRERMNFQMHIRRLSESRREQLEEVQGRGRGGGTGQQDSEDSNSDSSEQVTSTSDTNIRRRSIIAH